MQVIKDIIPEIKIKYQEYPGPTDTLYSVVPKLEEELLPKLYQKKGFLDSP